jgi:DNA-binding NarL/FixJ family response regulator
VSIIFQNRAYGREEELEALAKVIRSTSTGRGAVAAVEGYFGIGRTTLIAEAVEIALANHFHVMTATAHADEQDTPFAVVRQLLSQEPLDVGANAVELHAHTLDQIEWSVFPNGSAPTPVDGDEPASPQAYHTWDRLLRLVKRMAAESPLLIAIDDVHLADVFSLRWLCFLCRRIECLPITLIITYQTGEPVDPTLIADIFGGTWLKTRIALHDLPEAAIAQMARDHLGCALSAVQLRDCREQTGGHPLLLRHQLQHMARRGLAGRIKWAGMEEGELPSAPAGEHDGLANRFTRTVPHADLMLRALAALGGSGDPKLVAEVCELPVVTVLDAGDQLMRLGVLGGPALQLRYPFLVMSIYHDTPARQRTELHVRIAAALYTRGEPGRILKAHLMSADELPELWMLEVLLAEGQALCRASPTVAVDLLKRVLDGKPPAFLRCNCLHALGVAELSLDVTAAVGHLWSALAEAERPDQRLEITRELVTGLALLERNELSVELLSGELARLADPTGVPAIQVAEWLEGIAVQHARTLPMVQRPSWTARRRSILDDSPYAILRDNRNWSVHQVRDLADSLLSRHRVAFGSHPWYQALLCLVWCGSLDTALKYCDAEVRLARRAGRRAEALAIRSHIRLRLSRLPEALADAKRSLAELRKVGVDKLTSGRLAKAVLAEIAVQTGDYELAAVLSGESAFIDTASDHWWYTHWLHGRASLRGWLGDARGGIADAVRCGQLLRHWNLDSPSVLPWRSTAATLHLALKDFRRARVLATTELRLARRWGTGLAIGRAMRVAAMTMPDDEAAVLRTEAIAVLEATDAPLELAHVLAETGAAQRNRDLEAARGLLHRAHQLAVATGASALADSTAKEVRKAGGRLRHQPDKTRIDLLTSSQRQIAKLAASGLSNRRIASEMFVTLRNVEAHLTQVYRKLQVAGRHELPTTLDLESGS